MTFSSKQRLFQILFFLGWAVGLVGCQSTEQPLDPVEIEKARLAAKRSKSLLRKVHSGFPAHFSMEQVQKYMHEGEFKEASRYVNGALQLSVRNPSLHILNGLIYEVLAQSGEDVNIELAGIAYRTAKSLDGSNWVSSYLLGLHELQVQRYDQAQKDLADAIALRPEDVDILYAFTYASYYLGDLPAALASLKKLRILAPKDFKVVRAAVIILAAADKTVEAEATLRTYQNLEGVATQDVQNLKQRLEDWKQTHIQARTHPSPQEEEDSAGDMRPPGASDEEGPETVGIDFYTLRLTEEEIAIKGENVMEALNVTLGGTAPIAQFEKTINKVGTAAATGSWTKTFNFAINPGTVEYNLKLINANVTTRILEASDRPSIYTLVGKPASFYSGTTYIGTSAGSSGAGVMDISTGSKVEVTPLESKGDFVTLEIMVTGSLFIQEPNLQVGINDQMLAITKAKVANTIRVRYDQTIVIGGMQSNTRVSNNDGVPLLQDIPILQYFFKTERSVQDRRSILFLLTPRRGSGKPVAAKKMPDHTVVQRLQGVGLMALGEYSNLYYIMRQLEQSQMFANFRSGDILKPFYGYNSNSMEEKFEQLSKFVYY